MYFVGVLTTLGAGKRVLLDVSPPKLTSIVVSGQGTELVFDNRDIALDLNWLRVDTYATLVCSLLVPSLLVFVVAFTIEQTIGSPSCPITANVTVTLYGARTVADDIGKHVLRLTRVVSASTHCGTGAALGAKGITVLESATGLSLQSNLTLY